jgi:3-mercaptopyruvate sulfurtransferase SseA
LKGGLEAWQAAGGLVEPKDHPETAPKASKHPQRQEDKSAANRKIAEEARKVQKELEDEVTGAAQRGVIPDQETG